MKPILPNKILINTKHSYKTFRKNHIKVSLNLEINQHVNEANHTSRVSKLLKIFKALKYTSKLDLSHLQISQRSKTIYFAKRMSNTQVLQLSDDNLPPHEIKGAFEPWPIYFKRIKALNYHAIETRAQNRSLLNNLLFRYQPWIKDLSVKSLWDAHGFFENYSRRRGPPISLEKFSLTLNNSTLCGRVATSSRKRFKYLKHFEIKSDQRDAEKAIALIMKPIRSLCPDLQSLSLSFGYSPGPEIISRVSEICLFQRPKQIKLRLPAIEDIFKIEEGLSLCSLTHLNLELKLGNEYQLLPIAQIIMKQRNLQNLKLKIDIWRKLEDFEDMKNLFKIIDNLLDLKSLSISITSGTYFRIDSRICFSVFGSPFPTLFKKSIPLESFKLHLQHFRFQSPAELLVFLKSLKPVAPNLKKLKIDVGHCKLNSKEGDEVLDFLKNFRNVRSLKLHGIIISTKKIFGNFIDNISRLSFLRSLTFNEVSTKLCQDTLSNYVERLLQKRGLEKLSCQISDGLQVLLKESFQPMRIKNIRRKNPSLLNAPSIPGFHADEYEIGSW